MTEPGSRGERPRRWGPIVIGLAAVAAFAVWLHFVGVGLWQREGEPPPTRPSGERPNGGFRAAPTEASENKANDRAAATAPATGPASRPASRPAEKWTPPRFTARKEDREAMVRVIGRYGLRNEAILDAMRSVPRHEFVPKTIRSAAYRDRPLPIGHGQTISQPFMVAAMTNFLKLRSDSRVLEIGTGSGYQAAVLTEFTPHVYTIEIIKPLADAAAQRLKRLGYTTVKTRNADGYFGWPGEGKFDAIIVTCAAGQIPPPLLKQLAPGGRMVIPVGRPYSVQSLMLIERQKDGSIRSRNLMGVRFVPFTRKDRSGG